MICAVTESSSTPQGDNILAVVRTVGQRVRIRLRNGGTLEVTIDNIRENAVGLVFAVSGGLKFIGTKGQDENEQQKKDNP